MSDGMEERIVGEVGLVSCVNDRNVVEPPGQLYCCMGKEQVEQVALRIVFLMMNPVGRIHQVEEILHGFHTLHLFARLGPLAVVDGPA